jgi:hypothetical protein
MHLTYRDSPRHTSTVLPASADEAGAPDIPLNIDMVRAGVAVLEGWNRETEPEQCIVTEIFYAMLLEAMRVRAHS